MQPAFPCPCCGLADFKRLLEFPSIPVSGIYRASTADDQPVNDLAWDVCTRCGLVRNCNFRSPPDYLVKPRPTQRQLPAYLQVLLDLISAKTGKDDAVIEIGANDGSFLDVLRSEGYSNLHGVEPSAELSRVAKSRGHRIVEDYFTEDAVEKLLTACGAPKFVICRHTLEHVPDPAGFMAGIRRLLAPARGCALIEVPDSSAMWEGINFVELWDEHLFYFSPQTLHRLASRVGLSVNATLVFPHLETRNLMMHVCASDSEHEQLLVLDADGEAPRWTQFAENFRHVCAQLQAAILKAPRPLYFMGASHPQTNLVNFLALADRLDFMVDDDPDKLGKLPPVMSDTVRVVSSGEFATHPTGGTLVLSGLGYAKWSDLLKKSAAARGMDVIDPRHCVANGGGT